MSDRRIFVLSCLVLALTGTGCDESLRSIAGPTPNLTPTFSIIQREIFENPNAAAAGGRACVSCHQERFRRFVGGLSLESDVAYRELVNVPSRDQPGAVRVIPGDPENSYLIHKLEGRPGIAGGRMPLRSPAFLTDGQILIIRRWIQRGARND